MHIRNNSYDEIYDRVLKLFPVGKLTANNELFIAVISEELSKIWKALEDHFDCHTIINR